MERLVKLLLLACVMVSVLAGPAIVGADMVPLREGTVVSTTETETVSYVLAKDASGKEFWVLTTQCIIADGAKIEVLAGGRYDNIKIEKLGKVVEDVYTAQLIRVAGKEIKGFGTHALPSGCINLRR